MWSRQVSGPTDFTPPAAEELDTLDEIIFDEANLDGSHEEDPGISDEMESAGGAVTRERMLGNVDVPPGRWERQTSCEDGPTRIPRIRKAAARDPDSAPEQAAGGVDQSGAGRASTCGKGKANKKALFKTKMCTFHLLGRCKRGTFCEFAHGREELQNPPDLSCSRLCPRFLKAGKCTDSHCRFAHSEAELRAEEDQGGHRDGPAASQEASVQSDDEGRASFPEAAPPPPESATILPPIKAPMAGQVRVKNTFITIEEPPTPGSDASPLPCPPQTEPNDMQSHRLCPTVLRGGQCLEPLCRFQHDVSAMNSAGQLRSRVPWGGFASGRLSKELPHPIADVDEADLGSSAQSTAPSMDGGVDGGDGGRVSTTPSPDSDSTGGTPQSEPQNYWSEPEHEEVVEQKTVPPACSSWGLREPSGPLRRPTPHRPLANGVASAPAFAPL
jgi:hypothetical protein